MKEQNCNNCVYWNSEDHCKECPNKANKKVVRDLNKDEKEKQKKYMEDLCNLEPNPSVNVIGPAGKGHNFRMKDYLQD